MLVEGCDWLQDNLINHPQTLEKLQVCQTKELFVAAASTLVTEGEKLVEKGDYEEAMAKFKKAKIWNSKFDFNPEKKAAPAFVKKGIELAHQGEVQKAVAAYTKAQKIDPTLKISANDWNTLCWFGSLDGGAKDVMFACEKAVALAPKHGGIRDSRGVARALTGDTKGAIEDFEAFVQWIDNDEYKSKRQGWIKDLRAGKNPFTPEVLRELRND